MGITTTGQAMDAFSRLLRGGDETLDLLRALEHADRGLVIEAAAALLVGEAAVVLGEKGWSVPDAQRAATRTGGFSGSSRTTIEAALGEPVAVPQRLRAGRQRQFDLVLDVSRMLGVLRRLPKLAPMGPPRGADGGQAKLHAKVRALLAKAESTPFEAEQMACTAKAQELMARYAIDEAVLSGRDAAPGAASSMRVAIETPYARPKAILLSRVASNNRCRAVWSSDYGFSTVFGATRDLWAVDLLYTSLLVQAVVAVQREEERSRSFRHAFLVGFAGRIGERLRKANAVATAAATAASGDAFLPVLAATEDAAVAARDAAFPRRERLRVSLSSAAGVAAGRQAANRASISRDASVPERSGRAERPMRSFGAPRTSR